MDKAEYRIATEHIKKLIAKGEYAEASHIADTIDWSRVKSVMMLCTVSDLYKINRRYKDAKEILYMAYERNPESRTILYSLCDLSIKLEEFVPAIEYYKSFVEVAPRDTGRYVLQYRLYQAQDVGLEERIEVLEQLKNEEYTEKWAYELAYLYHRIGFATKCVEECDELILWFGTGRYVYKAMELKMLHEPLTPSQQRTYDHRFEHLDQVKDMTRVLPRIDSGDSEMTDESMVDVTDAPTVEIPKEYIEKELHPEPEEIQVKTLDVANAYNTMNLQKELADSLREILEANQAESEAVPEVIIEDVTEAVEEAIEEPAVNDQITGQLSFDDIFAAFDAEKEKDLFAIMEESFGEEAEDGEEPGAEEYEALVEDEITMEEEQVAEEEVITEEEQVVEDKVTVEEEPFVVEETIREEEIIENEEELFFEDIPEDEDSWDAIEAALEAASDEYAKELESEFTAEQDTEFDFEEAFEESDDIREVTLPESEDGWEEAFEESQDIREGDLPESEYDWEEAFEENQDIREEVLPESEDGWEEAFEDRQEESLAEDEISVVNGKDLSKYKDFIRVKDTEDQIVEAGERISMKPFSGNVAITGHDLSICFDFIKVFMTDLKKQGFATNGKTAKISAVNLNKKEPCEIIKKVQDGILIIERVGRLRKETVVKMEACLKEEVSSILIFATDTDQGMNRFAERYPSLAQFFDLRVDIKDYTGEELVTYAAKYAYDKEYSIDEMGLLALHKRINEMITNDESPTMNDAQCIVDEAITRADMKNLKHFMDVLLHKRYDKEDMIILREEDFL